MLYLKPRLSGWEIHLAAFKWRGGGRRRPGPGPHAAVTGGRQQTQGQAAACVPLSQCPHTTVTSSSPGPTAHPGAAGPTDKHCSLLSLGSISVFLRKCRASINPLLLTAEVSEGFWLSKHFSCKSKYLYYSCVNSQNSNGFYF